MSQMLGISLGNIKVLYDEKYDKCSFVKNIILDNILPSDTLHRGRDVLTLPGKIDVLDCCGMLSGAL